MSTCDSVVQNVKQQTETKPSVIINNEKKDSNNNTRCFVKSCPNMNCKFHGEFNPAG